MPEETPFITEPITATGTLADKVTEVLRQKIKTGEVAINARLPSEAVLSEGFGVSRTVIREAISRLKAEGLVETRQGKGTIVVEATNPMSFQLNVDIKNSLEVILRIIELRRGLEGEMSALAAMRRTPEQNADVQRALAAIDTAVEAGGDGVEEDFAFHSAVSKASGNPLYTSMLDFLSQFLIDVMRVSRINEAQRSDFMGQLQNEHTAIALAIAQQDTVAARNAAWLHLENVTTRMQSADAEFWRSEGGELARKLAKAEVTTIIPPVGSISRATRG